MNKINTKIDDLNIKIRLKNEISFRCINTIDFLILSLELVVSPPKKKKFGVSYFRITLFMQVLENISLFEFKSPSSLMNKEL